MNVVPPVVPVLGATAILLLTLELLRRRHLREKYALLWLLVSVGSLLLALFPELLDWLARVSGFGLPVNLLFFGSFLVLLAVSMQLSLEVGRREAETERLAEEIALIRLEMARLSGCSNYRSPNDDQPAP
jgi:hypothetical protein